MMKVFPITSLSRFSRFSDQLLLRITVRLQDTTTILFKSSLFECPARLVSTAIRAAFRISRMELDHNISAAAE